MHPMPVCWFYKCICSLQIILLQWRVVLGVILIAERFAINLSVFILNIYGCLTYMIIVTYNEHNYDSLSKQNIFCRITADLKVETNIFGSKLGRTVILVIMYVETFKTVSRVLQKPFPMTCMFKISIRLKYVV